MSVAGKCYVRSTLGLQGRDKGATSLQGHFLARGGGGLVVEASHEGVMVARNFPNIRNQACGLRHGLRAAYREEMMREG